MVRLPIRKIIDGFSLHVVTGASRRLAGHSLAWLFLCLAFPSVAFAHNDNGYSHDRLAVGNHPDWMAWLDDNLKLSEISIPGTHDTMADCPGLVCGTAPLPKDVVQTQSMTLQQQLVSGIRALDIRLQYKNIDSAISNPLSPQDCVEDDAVNECAYFLFHGAIPLYTRFQSDVMGVVTTFLADNPSETIIMRVKKEGGDNGELFARRMEALLANYADFLVPKSCNPGSTISIILGPQGSANSCHARGRIAIVRDYDTLDEGHLYDIGRWSSIFNGPHLQDDYSVGTNWDLYSKWEKVKTHLLASNLRANPDRMWGNFLSASGGSFPYFIASGHSSSGTGAPRLSTGLTTPAFNGSYPDFPRTTCVSLLVTVCTISFEGTNSLTKNFLFLQNYLYPEGRPGHVSYVGVVWSDFPGIGLIQQILLVNLGTVPSTVNQTPQARCQDIQIEPEGACAVEIVPELVDGGSFDPEIGSVLTRSLSPDDPLSAMGVYPVTLTVSDVQGLEDSCAATITLVCDSDGDGIVDDDDEFPSAVTAISVPREESGDIAISITPDMDASSCNLVDVWFEPLSSSPPGMGALDFQVGFELTGCAVGEAVEVTVDFGEPWPRGSQPYKVVGNRWSLVSKGGVFPRQSGTSITYRVVDNGPLDSDPAGGRIVDPVTMAVPPPPPPIPSLSPWLLLLLSVSLAALGLRRLAVSQSQCN